MTPLMALDVLILAVGIGVLYFGAESLVRGSARLAGSLGVSPIVVGLTIVSFGTSAPELVVGSVAAFGGNAGLAVGNVLGSNLANLGLILGLTALVRPLSVHARVVWREVPIMLLATVALYPLLMWDYLLTPTDGFVLLLGLVVYLYFVFRWVGDEAPEILGEYEEFMKASAQETSTVRTADVGLVILGSAFLVAGGYLIVEGAVNIADALGISQVTIGLTVVAVGTSLPELATSIVATMRDEADIAVGNVIGSNIFNLTAILGVASMAGPIRVEPTVLTRELPAVLVLSLIVLPLLRTDWQIERWEGAMLLVGYVSLGVWIL